MRFKYGYVTVKELDPVTHDVVGVVARVDPSTIEPDDDEARALSPAELDARRDGLARQAETELRERGRGAS